MTVTRSQNIRAIYSDQNGLFMAYILQNIIIIQQCEPSTESLITMQQSYLSSGSQSQQQSPKHQIPEPQRKMYGMQLAFMYKFKKQIQQIQAGIQKVLIQLTKCQEADKDRDKRRLPYNVIKVFEKSLKQMRRLTQFTIEENMIYKQELQNREKEKIYKNALFKTYLKQLGSKKQQLKIYINKLQARVRNLQDTGYAQFVQYEVVVPQTNTIRFSYSARTLLTMVFNRNQNCMKVADQLQRRIQINRKIEQKYFINKHKQNNVQTCNTQQKQKDNKEKDIKLQQNEGKGKKQNKQNKKSKQRIKTQKQLIKKGQADRKLKIPLLLQKDLSIVSVLDFFRTYKYYCNQRVIILDLLKIRVRKQQLKIQIQRLKQAMKGKQQQLYKTKLRVGFMKNDKTYTKTDSLIYLKQLKNEIKQKVDNRIFMLNQQLHKYRSKSCKSQSIYPNNQ